MSQNDKPVTAVAVSEERLYTASLVRFENGEFRVIPFVVEIY